MFWVLFWLLSWSLMFLWILILIRKKIFENILISWFLSRFCIISFSFFFPFCGEAIVFGRGVRDWRRLSYIRMLFKPESKALSTFWLRYETSQGAGKAFFHLCPLRALYSAKSSESWSINLPKNSPTST